MGRTSRLRLKCDGTGAETRFRLSAKWTSPFKSAGWRQFSLLLAAEVCVSAVVMLDTTRSEVVWRVLATQSIRQFPLHFPSRALPCAITFQLDSTSFIPSWYAVEKRAQRWEGCTTLTGCWLYLKWVLECYRRIFSLLVQSEVLMAVNAAVLDVTSRG